MANRCFPPKMKAATVLRICTIDSALRHKVPGMFRTFPAPRRSRKAMSQSVNRAFRTPSNGDMISAHRHRRTLNHLT